MHDNTSHHVSLTSPSFLIPILHVYDYISPGTVTQSAANAISLCRHSRTYTDREMHKHSDAAHSSLNLALQQFTTEAFESYKTHNYSWIGEEWFIFQFPILWYQIWPFLIIFSIERVTTVSIILSVLQYPV